MIIIALAAVVQPLMAAEQMPLTFTEPYLLTLSPREEMNVCWLTSESVVEAYVEYGVPAHATEAESMRLSTRSRG